MCDIGCGPHAQLLRDLSGHVKEGIGIDKKVPEESFGNIQLKKIVFEGHLPLQNESVDVVTILAVLEHLVDPVQMLKEIKRILKPNGNLLITVPTVPNKYIAEFLAFKLHLIDAEEHRDHKRYYLKPLLKTHLHEAGFNLDNAKMNYFELGMNLFAKVKK